jgi:hypothetical protein
LVYEHPARCPDVVAALEREDNPHNGQDDAAVHEAVERQGHEHPEEQ